MVNKWFVAFVDVWIWTLIALLVPDEIAEIRKWVRLLFHHPSIAIRSLWDEFWKSWAAVGTAATLCYAGAFVPEMIGFGTAKSLFFLANSLFFIRLCLEEKLHGNKQERKPTAQRTFAMTVLLAGFLLVSFVEWGAVANKANGKPATTRNIWNASFFWRSHPAAMTAPSSIEAQAGPKPPLASPGPAGPTTKPFQRLPVNPLEIVSFDSESRISLANHSDREVYVIDARGYTDFETTKWSLGLTIPPGQLRDSVTKGQSACTTEALGQTWEEHVKNMIAKNRPFIFWYFSADDDGLDQIKEHYRRTGRPFIVGTAHAVLRYRVIDGVSRDTRSQPVKLSVITAYKGAC